MKATQATAGVLPAGNGQDARYVTLTGATTLEVPEWERIGRPCWSVRWVSDVELPGGESRPEYLYARTRIPCYERFVVAGVPPFESIGVEYGFHTPGRVEWYAPAVVAVPSLGAARSLVRDTRAAGGDYITWDRALSARDHQLYLLDGADPRDVGTVPIYPETDRVTAQGGSPYGKSPAPMIHPDRPAPARSGAVKKKKRA